MEWRNRVAYQSRRSRRAVLQQAVGAAIGVVAPGLLPALTRCDADDAPATPAAPTPAAATASAGPTRTAQMLQASATATPQPRTGFAYDPRFLLHDLGSWSVTLPSGERTEPDEQFSSARITRRTAQLIGGSGILTHLVPIAARAANVDELAAFHTRDYIERVRFLAESGGGEAGPYATVVAGTWEAATLAAGAAIAVTEAVLDGQITNGYGLLRPPGHHAVANQGMGYCIFNNVVIAVRHALQRGLQRVLIVDWDVHHGNGTQAAFWDDPNVLYVSLHQDNWYPGGSGAVDQIGGRGAEGTTINIPLPPGTGNRGYQLAFERLILPVAEQFRPELIFVSAGYDASMMDQLGRMIVTSGGFRAMAGQLRELAARQCDGRLVALQEGGYSSFYVPYCTLATLEGLADRSTVIGEALAGDSELVQAEREFRPDQEAAVEAASSVQADFWRL